jgi:hypothetical protein
MQLDKISEQIRLFAFYRETDLYVSRLLMKFLRFPRSDRFTLRVWRHLADQTRHASLWSEQLEFLRTRDLLWDISALCEKRPSPDQLDEPGYLLQEMAVVEEFLLKSYQMHSTLESLDNRARDLMVRLIEDEKRHLQSVRSKLEMIPIEGVSAGNRTRRFRAVEEELYDVVEITSASDRAQRVE